MSQIATLLATMTMVSVLEKTDGQSGMVTLVGAPGPPGTGISDADALHVSQRLAEFDTPAAKAAARANLELETIDGGTFS